MKNRIFIILIIIYCTGSFALAEWEPVGPYGGYLRVLANDPVNTNVLYTASYRAPSKIFKSSDFGESWEYLSTVPNYVYSIAIDPTQTNIIYAGSYSQVFKSSDGGHQWKIIDVPVCEVNAIAVRQDTPAILYATGMTFTGGQYVMNFAKSSDAGSTWVNTPLNTYGGYAYCMAYNPIEPQTVYVGGYYYDTTTQPCVYKSTDGGGTFNEMSFGLPTTSQRVHSLAIHPTDPNILYAGTYYGGIYRSTDAGFSWSYISGGAWFISSIATSPSFPDRAYAAADTVIYITTNSGATWFRSGNGYKGARRTHRCVVMHPADSSIVYTTDYHGFSKTMNGGDSWYASNEGINIAQINCMTVFKPDPAIMYVYSEGYGIYRSLNNGSSWTSMPSPFACRLGDVIIHNSDPDILIAIEGDG